MDKTKVINMKLLKLLLLVIITSIVWNSYHSGYELKRTMVAMPGYGTKFVDIALFNTNESDDYNRENCELAASLLQRQPGVTTTFLCFKR